MKTRRQAKRHRRGSNKTSRAYSPSSPSPSMVEYPDVESAVYAFHQMTKNLDYEICATISTDKSPTNQGGMGAQLILHNKTKVNIDKPKDSCNYSKGYSKIILHNHPDKYYPSIEDLEKIVKNKDQNMIIRESYITCRFGIWMFSVQPKNKISKNILLSKHNEMKKELDAFYKMTGRGREFNKTAIDMLCEKIHEIYGINAEFF